jgi:hypothetical protein
MVRVGIRLSGRMMVGIILFTVRLFLILINSSIIRLKNLARNKTQSRLLRIEIGALHNDWHWEETGGVFSSLVFGVFFSQHLKCCFYKIKIKIRKEGFDNG